MAGTGEHYFCTMTSVKTVRQHIYPVKVSFALLIWAAK
jgi:hypothetical protein